MAKRPTIPAPTERAIVTKSRHRCSICFGLSGKDEVQKGQIAHLDGDRNNNNEGNLCWLCLDHHDDFDSTTSQSKNYEIGEVKHYREELYEEMEFRYFAIKVERRLRLAKQALREIAHKGLLLQIKPGITKADFDKWEAEAIPLVRRFAGEPAEYDFVHCKQFMGERDLGSVSQIQDFLRFHARFLKKLARRMDATDVVKCEDDPA